MPRSPALRAALVAATLFGAVLAVASLGSRTTPWAGLSRKGAAVAGPPKATPAAALCSRSGSGSTAVPGGSTAAPAGSTACNLSLVGSEADARWLQRRCKLLSYVCADQGSLILHGQEYRPRPGARAEPLPDTTIGPWELKYIYPYRGSMMADLYADTAVSAASYVCHTTAGPGCRLGERLYPPGRAPGQRCMHSPGSPHAERPG